MHTCIKKKKKKETTIYILVLQYQAHANTETPRHKIVGSRRTVPIHSPTHTRTPFNFYLSSRTAATAKKILLIKTAVYPCLHISPVGTELLQTPRCAPPHPDPDCEVGSGGEHNCMLKRLRNGRPVLLSWWFLCGLIVGTCSHAAL